MAILAEAGAPRGICRSIRSSIQGGRCPASSAQMTDNMLAPIAALLHAGRGQIAWRGLGIRSGIRSTSTWVRRSWPRSHRPKQRLRRRRYGQGLRREYGRSSGRDPQRAGRQFKGRGEIAGRASDRGGDHVVVVGDTASSSSSIRGAFELARGQGVQLQRYRMAAWPMRLPSAGRRAQLDHGRQGGPTNRERDVD